MDVYCKHVYHVSGTIDLVQFGSMPRIQDTTMIFLNQVIEKRSFPKGTVW